jgi:uncharacterized repeat protein (TIGR01451 family)
MAHNYLKSMGLVMAIGGTLATMEAPAQEAIEIETQLIAQVREVTDVGAGRERYRFVPATVLSEGQVVYYTLRITNPAPVFAKNVVVTQRIPANTTYVAGSAAAPGADVSFSFDGGETFLPLEQLTIDVEGRRQPAPPTKFTHIRWHLRNPLAPGAVALARFRAVFN